MKTAAYDFTDSVVLVTGGGTGIGQAITHAFLDAGATVAITGRRRERLEQASPATLPRLADVGGTFVAVSSVSGDRGDWGQAAYNATKAAVTNFVRSLALDRGSAACGSTP